MKESYVHEEIGKLIDYHKNSEKVEFTITEEKEPFPELEDIEWIMVKPPSFYNDNKINGILLNHQFTSDLGTAVYNHMKTYYENSKDFKVSFKLKEKINRKLHENRALALAIGKMMLEEGSCINVISVGYSKKVILHAVSGGYAFNLYYPDSGKIGWSDYATLPEDYIIPEKVLQWMKEYQEQGIR